MGDFPLLLSSGTLLIGGIVWLVRLEGRVNGHDREHRDVREDLAYIRERIDRALNGRHS